MSKYFNHLDIGRPVYPEHTKMRDVVKFCEIFKDVEKGAVSLD